MAEAKGLLKRKEKQYDSDALQAIFNYYMNDEYGDSLKITKADGIILGLELLGGSAGIYYWPSALAYAKNDLSWIKYSFALGNSTTGVLFLINASDGFFRSILLESQAPPEIADKLQLPSREEVIKKNIKILIGSALCSAPIAIVTYLYPLDNCKSDPCRLTATVHSWVANSMLHAVPWYLILSPQFWYYRIPILPVEKLYAYIQERKLSLSEQQKLNLIKQKEAIYNKYRINLSNGFLLAAQTIVNKSLKSEAKEEEFDFESAPALMDKAENLKAPSSIPLTPNSPKTYLEKFQNFMVNYGSPFIGDIFMIVGTIGWIADPFYLGDQIFGFDKTETALFGILPSYSMAVLSAFYGGNILGRSYHWLTTWNKDAEKFPSIAYQYPKLYSAFILINAYLSFFSFATAVELINVIFEDEIFDAYRIHLKNTAKPALMLLSFVALNDLFILWANKAIAKWGKSENKLLIRLQLKAKLVADRLMQLKGEELMVSIKALTPAQRQAFAIDEEQFNLDQQQLVQLNSQPMEYQGSLISSPRLYKKPENKSGCCQWFSFYSAANKLDSEVEESYDLEKEAGRDNVVNY